MTLHFETMLLYFESVFVLYFEGILLHFVTMLASSCSENQYSKSKEKVVTKVPFINADLLCCWGYRLRLFRNVRRLLHKMMQNAWQLHEHFCGGPGKQNIQLEFETTKQL